MLAGIAAALLGAPNALVLGGVFCITIIAGISRFNPQLWRYRSDESQREI